MKDEQLEIEEYVPELYKRECYEAWYAPIIYLVNGETLWPKIKYADLQPLPIKRQPGMSKTKRTKNVAEIMRDETQLKRDKFGIKCSMCHMIGHKKANCKLLAPSQTTQSAPS